MEFSGKRLARARGDRSQLDLADQSGVTVTTISRLENGHHKPELATIVSLARALGVEPADLCNSTNGGNDEERT